MILVLLLIPPMDALWLFECRLPKFWCSLELLAQMLSLQPAFRRSSCSSFKGYQTLASSSCLFVNGCLRWKTPWSFSPCRDTQRMKWKWLCKVSRLRKCDAWRKHPTYEEGLPHPQDSRSLLQHKYAAPPYRSSTTQQKQVKSRCKICESDRKQLVPFLKHIATWLSSVRFHLLQSVCKPRWRRISSLEPSNVKLCDCSLRWWYRCF